MNELFYFDKQLIDGLEFCSRVYALFEKIRSEPDGIENLRLRELSPMKQLMDELLPICKYVQRHYRTGRYISVCWVYGSQSYGAMISQNGEYIEQGYYPSSAYLEVTSAMHEHEHWTWEFEASYAPEGIKKRNGRFLSEPVVFTNQEHVEKFVPILLNRIQSKSEILYPKNTSLIIQCHLNSLYTEDDWNLLVKLVSQKLPKHDFSEIFVFDSVMGREAKL